MGDGQAERRPRAAEAEIECLRTALADTRRALVNIAFAVDRWADSRQGQAYALFKRQLVAAVRRIDELLPPGDGPTAPPG